MIILWILKKTSTCLPEYLTSVIKVDEATSSARVNRHPPKLLHGDYKHEAKGVASMLLQTAVGISCNGCSGTSAGRKSSDVTVTVAPSACLLVTQNVVVLLISFLSDAQGNLEKILIAIGDQGTILPNVTWVYYTKTMPATSPTDGQAAQPAEDVQILVQNPERLCCLAIVAYLDLYYDIQRDDWTLELVQATQQKVRALQTLHIVLYQVMVSICRTETKGTNYEVWMTLLRSSCNS